MASLPPSVLYACAKKLVRSEQARINLSITAWTAVRLLRPVMRSTAAAVRTVRCCLRQTRHRTHFLPAAACCACVQHDKNDDHMSSAEIASSFSRRAASAFSVTPTSTQQTGSAEPESTHHVVKLHQLNSSIFRYRHAEHAPLNENFQFQLV